MSQQHQLPKPPCMTIACNAREAYRLPCIGVNRPTVLALLATACLLGSGCVPPPRAVWDPPYLIATRYAPLPAADGPVADRVAGLHHLGVTALVVSTERTPEDHLAALHEAAMASDMVLMEDVTRSAARRIRWGIGSDSDTEPTHPALDARAVPLGFSAAAQRRSLEARRRTGRVVRVPGEGEQGGGVGVLGVIDVGGDADPDASQTEQLLRQFHEALVEGRTAGILLESSGSPRWSEAGSSDPARMSAWHQMIGRAQAWGPRLANLTARIIAPPDDWGGDGRIALFEDGDRRYLLIFNRSDSRYLRKPYAFPASEYPPVAVRAVQVPTSPTGLPGQVKEASRDRIHLAPELRPGDAVLYELFHQTRAADPLPAEPAP
jgi:hypothetical protein